MLIVCALTHGTCTCGCLVQLISISSTSCIIVDFEITGPVADTYAGIVPTAIGHGQGMRSHHCGPVPRNKPTGCKYTLWTACSAFFNASDKPYV